MSATNMFDALNRIEEVLKLTDTSESEVLELSALKPEVASALKSALKKSFHGLVFRKAWKIFAKEDDLEKVSYYTPNKAGRETYTVMTPRDYLRRRHNFTAEEHEKNLELHHSRFSLVTNKFPYPRGNNDPYAYQQIYCYSAQYAELDLTNDCDLKLHYRKRHIAPRKDDLICMLVEPPTAKDRNPTAKAWFNCSGQFYHLYNAVMFDDHPSFREEPRQREWLMSGGRTMTNAYKKWILCHCDNDLEPNLTEMNNRFRHVRTEESSRRWVHVYSALALMTRYQELPSRDNVPNNKSGGPLMKYWQEYHGREEWPEMQIWSLPDGWLSKILGKWTDFTPGEVDAEAAVRRDVKVPETVKPKEVVFTEEDFPPLKPTAKKQKQEKNKKTWTIIVKTAQKMLEIEEEFDNYEDMLEGQSWADLCC